MDATRFDTLIKRFASQPMTRATALRGLGASVAALAGVTLVAEPQDAESRKLGNVRRKRICVCSTGSAASCKQVKVIKKKAKKLLKRNPCNYRGRCTGVSGCPGGAPLGCSPANNTQGSCQPGQLCNPQAICVAGCTGQSGTQGSCPTGQICVNGQCQNQGQPLGCSPANDTQGSCPAGQICNTRAICVPAVGCLNTANPQCSANQVCCPSESARAGECRGSLQAC